MCGELVLYLPVRAAMRSKSSLSRATSGVSVAVKADRSSSTALATDNSKKRAWKRDKSTFGENRALILRRKQREFRLNIDQCRHTMAAVNLPEQQTNHIAMD